MKQIPLLALLAVACGPPSAISVAPGAVPQLAQVDALFLDTAVQRGPEGEVERDLRRGVESRMSTRLPPIPPRRGEADAILVFELAATLDCEGCIQAAGLWQWWGFVFDLQGRELASLHGELPRTVSEPWRPFVEGVRRVIRRSRRATR